MSQQQQTFQEAVEQKLNELKGMPMQNGENVQAALEEMFRLGADFGRDYEQQNVPHGTLRIPMLGSVK